MRVGVGLLVYFTPRRAWTALVGLYLAGTITVGCFTYPNTAYRLQHPENIGPLLGTLVQFAGLLLALVAGVATIIRAFVRWQRSRSAPVRV